MYPGVLKFAAILESMAPGVLNREHRVATSAYIVRLPLCLWRTDFGVVGMLARATRSSALLFLSTVLLTDRLAASPRADPASSTRRSLIWDAPSRRRVKTAFSLSDGSAVPRRSTTRFLRFRSGCGPAANRLTSARVPSTTKTPQSYSFLCWLMGASCRLAPTRSAIVAASLSLYPRTES